MTKDIAIFFSDGCGRCSLFGTPDCKVHTWQKELRMLRQILNECGLTETMKWGSPCYTFNDANLVNIAALKNYCALGFFKGALLADPHKLLQKAGEESQSAMYMRFTDTKQIVAAAADIRAYVFEAMEIEKSGLKVNFKSIDEMVLPAELLATFETDKIYEKAFRSLTPGRQRGYIIHFNQPKQEATRYSRIEKAKPQILLGKGMNDDYRDRSKGSQSRADV
jgi:uncharacterized protein YdeI (YjbR/CyaY-like superfamily)